MPKLNVRATFCGKVQPSQQGSEGSVSGYNNLGVCQHFGYVMTKSIGRLLAEGTLKGHPVQTFEGLEGIEKALKDLKDGKASAVKYVINIGEEYIRCRD